MAIYNNQFDLIIYHEFLKNSTSIKAILNQLYFCLSNDVKIIIAGSQNTRTYKFLSKLLTSGFLSKKIE